MSLPPSVVLVEDSVPYARLVAVLLRDALPEGVEVRHHETLGAALDDLARRPADCVLLDLSLPDADGLEGLARLQAAGVEASIVVLSAREDDEIALAAIQAGAQDYLHKGDERETHNFTRAIRYAIERRRAQERSEDLLRAKEDRWRTLTHLAPVAITEHGPDGRCVFANDRWSELSGQPPGAELGFGFLGAIHPDDRTLFDAAWQQARDGEDGEFAVEGRFLRPDGTVVWVLATGVVLRDPWGGHGGWLGTTVDVSEARRAREALRVAEQRFRSAFDEAPVGMAIVGLDGAWLEVNRSFCDLVGRREEELVGRSAGDVTHPDDHRTGAERWGPVLAGDVSSAQWESRFLHADGHAVWTRLSVSLTRDEAGAPLNAIVQVEDVSARRLAEQELQRQQLDMLAVSAMARDAGVAEDPYVPLVVGARRLLQARTAALLVADGQDRLVIAAIDGGGEVAAGQAVPVGTAEPSGAAACFLARDRIEIEDARSSGAVASALVAASGARGAVFDPVLRGNDALGVLAIAWGEPRGPLSPREGTVVRLLAAELAAAIERRGLLDQLRDMARTDPLTGLPNRRVWDDRVVAELARAGRSGAPVCAAMLDLDRFKDFNDRNGHQAGDRLLRETTAAWQGILRPSDLLARLGGDEFALLLPDCDREAAHQIVQRLQGATRAEIGASAGIVRWTPGEDGVAFLARADEALYAAKGAGRGRIVMR